MSTAIVIDDSFSTSHNPQTGQTSDGYILRAEIAIGEAYLRKHPDAEIIGLVSGPVSDFDQLVPDNGTPIKGFLDAVEDFDQVVLIMDAALIFSSRGGYPVEKEIQGFLQKKLLNDTDIQIVLVMNPLRAAGSLAPPILHKPGMFGSETEESFRLRKMLMPHITMIVDPRAILDFGF